MFRRRRCFSAGWAQLRSTDPCVGPSDGLGSGDDDVHRRPEDSQVAYDRNVDACIATFWTGRNVGCEAGDSEFAAPLDCWNFCRAFAGGSEANLIVAAIAMLKPGWQKGSARYFALQRQPCSGWCGDRRRAICYRACARYGRKKRNLPFEAREHGLHKNDSQPETCGLEAQSVWCGRVAGQATRPSCNLCSTFAVTSSPHHRAPDDPWQKCRD